MHLPTLVLIQYLSFLPNGDNLTITNGHSLRNGFGAIQTNNSTVVKHQIHFLSDKLTT